MDDKTKAGIKATGTPTLPTQSVEKKLAAYGVPPKYLQSSFKNFEGNPNLVRIGKQYREGGLVLVGNTGCGKTHLAVAILRNMVQQNMIKKIRIRIGARRTKDAILSAVLEDKIYAAKMITAPSLLLKIRSSFNAQSFDTEEDIIKFLSEVPFLILDDLGSEKVTDYALTMLYLIIDRRDCYLKDTIITTNLSLQQIEKRLNARIASRLAGMKVVKINMPDYRKSRR